MRENTELMKTYTTKQIAKKVEKITKSRGLSKAEYLRGLVRDDTYNLEKYPELREEL